jgi:hypothetical protein
MTVKKSRVPVRKSAYSQTEQKVTEPKTPPTVMDIVRGFGEPIQGRSPAVLAGILLILIAFWFWHTPGNKHLPDELLGAWHTTNPVYANRTFTIDDVCITFTTGEGSISVGFIDDVQQIPAGTRTLYTVSYTVDGVPNVVSFYYDNGKNLWFKNQEKVVWQKDENS